MKLNDIKSIEVLNDYKELVDYALAILPKGCRVTFKEYDIKLIFGIFYNDFKSNLYIMLEDGKIELSKCEYKGLENCVEVYPYVTYLKNLELFEYKNFLDKELKPEKIP